MKYYFHLDLQACNKITQIQTARSWSGDPKLEWSDLLLISLQSLAPSHTQQETP